jgi:hypothetical protein
LQGQWVNEIMSRHIFAVAKGKLGLHVDSTKFGGGGHISLDSADLFGGNVEILLAVLKQLQTDAREWVAELKYDDPPNSPWLHEQGHGTDNRAGAAISQFTVLVDAAIVQIRQGRPSDFDAMVTSLRDFHKQIVNVWAVDKKRSGTADEKRSAANISLEKNRPHYQAVNVEHLVPEKPVGERRIELRSVGGQQNPDALHHDLDYIYERIEVALQSVRDRLADSAEKRNQ